ncbi:hypothetical protein [Gellertiella hungarica]|uniref:Uncharacterized protein n=1 Tax=Gellertiella hungarica TaxID=1572859 RepID=A0A7W6NMB5_9HYPH|nr:hypothetical protein [Gellertiella hungarica]MBB4066773.1 hypothetical protein [Gellertiella hungarica]
MDSYIDACQGLPCHSVKMVIEAICTGQMPGFSLKWAPTAPELGAAVREHAAHVQKQVQLAEERMQIEDKRPVPVAVRLVEQRVAEARAAMDAEERALLFTVESHAELVSRRRELPPGAKYCGILSAVFGPPGSAKSPPVDADVAW